MIPNCYKILLAVSIFFGVMLRALHLVPSVASAGIVSSHIFANHKWRGEEGHVASLVAHALLLFLRPSVLPGMPTDGLKKSLPQSFFLDIDWEKKEKIFPLFLHERLYVVVP